MWGSAETKRGPSLPPLAPVTLIVLILAASGDWDVSILDLSALCTHPGSRCVQHGTSQASYCQAPGCFLEPPATRGHVEDVTGIRGQY